MYAILFSMDGKRVSLYAIAVAIGFGLGWLSHSLLDNPDTTLAGSKSLPKESRSIPASAAPAPQADMPVAPAAPQSADIIDDQEPTDSDASVQEASDEDFDVDKAMAFIAKAGPRDTGEVMRLGEEFATHPEKVRQLLDSLLDMSDEQLRNSAISLLRGANSPPDYLVEAHIVDKMRNGERDSEWLSVLGNMGVESGEAIEFLGERLPYFTDNSEIASAIRAVSQNMLSFGRPSDISRETVETVTAQIGPYINSDDPRVRAAVLRSLPGFPRPEASALIVEGLKSDNELIRAGASRAIIMGRIKSPEIKHTLLDIMRDETRPMDARLHASFNLGNYALEGQDYEDLYAFQTDAQTKEYENRVMREASDESR